MDLFRDTDGFGRYTVRGYGRSYFTAGFGWYTVRGYGRPYFTDGFDRYTIRLYGRSSFMTETVPTLRTRNFTAILKNPDYGNWQTLRTVQLYGQNSDNFTDGRTLRTLGTFTRTCVMAVLWNRYGRRSLRGGRKTSMGRNNNIILAAAITFLLCDIFGCLTAWSATMILMICYNLLNDHSVSLK